MTTQEAKDIFKTHYNIQDKCEFALYKIATFNNPQQPKFSISINSGNNSLKIENNKGLNGKFYKILENNNPNKFEEYHKYLVNKYPKQIKIISDFTTEQQLKTYATDMNIIACGINTKYTDNNKNFCSILTICNNIKEQSPNNTFGMIFVSSPNDKNSTSTEQFKVNLCKSLQSIFELIEEYNKKAQNKINIIQMCKISGGESKHKDVDISIIENTILNY